MSRRHLAHPPHACAIPFLAHLAVYEDSLTSVVPGGKVVALIEWLLKCYPCTTNNSFWVRHDMHSGIHKLIKVLLHLDTKPYDFDFPFAAVAGLATGAIHLYHYSG